MLCTHSYEIPLHLASYQHCRSPERLCLFLCPNDLHNCEKLLVSLVSLLFLQYKHKVVVKATLHHDPVYRPREINISCQKYNIFALQRCNGLVNC